MPGKNIFVVHKHDARQLHYDFRLEIGGVLKSWAIPKGPSMNPRDKRLAIETEDHPLKYADFEGVIQEGQYGAGTVMVWDAGKYEKWKDAPMQELYKKGYLKFILKGRKLKGKFVLLKTRQGSGRQWLLIKARDEHASAKDVLLEAKSAKTGRTMEQIKKGTK